MTKIALKNKFLNKLKEYEIEGEMTENTNDFLKLKLKSDLYNNFSLIEIHYLEDGYWMKAISPIGFSIIVRKKADEIIHWLYEEGYIWYEEDYYNEDVKIIL